MERPVEEDVLKSPLRAINLSKGSNFIVARDVCLGYEIRVDNRDS